MYEAEQKMMILIYNTYLALTPNIYPIAFLSYYYYEPHLYKYQRQGENLKDKRDEYVILYIHVTFISRI